MWSLDRRRFMSSSLGVAAIALASSDTFSFATLDENANNPNSDQFSPDTLFLTWQGDPSTSMTIQWLGVETQADMSIEGRGADVYGSYKKRPSR